MRIFGNLCTGLVPYVVKLSTANPIQPYCTVCASLMDGYRMLSDDTLNLENLASIYLAHNPFDQEMQHSSITWLMWFSLKLKL